MSQVDDEARLGPMVLTMQIIIFALTMGLSIFLAIVLFVRVQPKPAPPQPFANPAQAQAAAPSVGLISSMAVVFAVMAVPMSLLIPLLMVRNGRKQIAQGTWTPPAQGSSTFPQGSFGDTFRLTMVYQTSLIVGAALNEGVAFFALIAYMLEGHPAVLGLAVLLILGVAARFPTRTRVEEWINAQKELMIQEQQTGQ